MSAAGLERRTRLATATLVLGANLPDIDVLAMVWGPVATVTIRRGWTHGVLALVVLPLVLTAMILGWDRVGRRGSSAHRPGAVPGQVLLLAYLALATHPALDFLNTYGMRWFMPFLNRWYYGDTLFIVDLWVWGLLACALWLTRRARVLGQGSSVGRARVALVILVGYVLAMGGGTAVARSLVSRELDRDPTAIRFMVGPVPLNPFVRGVVLARGDTIVFGRVQLGLRPRVTWQPGGVPVNREGAEAAGILAVADAVGFLQWARFPFFELDERVDSTIVHIIDARYATDRDAQFGTLRVALPRESANASEEVQEKAP